MLPNHLILCHPLLLLPSIFPRITVFSNELALLIRWPKYWSFSFSTSPSSEYPGLISFRIDWFDLLESILQHHNSKASILCHSVFLTALTSVHDYWVQKHTVHQNWIKKKYFGFPGGSVVKNLPASAGDTGSLVWEYLTCCWAMKPVHHNYWTCALEPRNHNYWNPYAATPIVHVL